MGPTPEGTILSRPPHRQTRREMTNNGHRPATHNDQSLTAKVALSQTAINTL